ncbi:MAG: chemotaxis protein CheD [Deltaproteobacteria bacterium]|nr:chemotaxis protein CheD [Deltaproteobacteria bacterium]
MVLVGVGELGASKTPGAKIKTMALGSCIAVVMMDPKTRCVGMVHVALPDSSINPKRAQERPGYFADTGIPALVKEMEKLGCQGGGRGWIVKLAGGANVADANNTFNVGKRNAIAIKKILWKLNIAPRSEDIGKNFSRTVTLEVSSGKTTITCPGRGSWGL